MPIESRGVPRPRPSLSCVTCRQRKVRCTREQPACNNCMRINGVCEYDSNPPTKSNAQAQEKRRHTAKESNGRSSNSRRGPVQEEGDWTDPSHKSSRSQRDMTEASADSGTSGNIYQHSASKDTPFYARGDVVSSSHDDLRSSSISVVDARDSFVPQAEEDKLTHDFSVPGFWTTTTEDAHTGRSSYQRPDIRSWNPMVPSSDRLPAPALKRRRNPVELSSQQEGGGTASSVRGGLDSLYDQGKSSTKPSSYTSSEDYTHSPGYLSVQNGGQLRYVGNSYWALVRGYVGEIFPVPQPIIILIFYLGAALR